MEHKPWCGFNNRERAGECDCGATEVSMDPLDRLTASVSGLDASISALIAERDAALLCAEEAEARECRMREVVQDYFSGYAGGIYQSIGSINNVVMLQLDREAHEQLIRKAEAALTSSAPCKHEEEAKRYKAAVEWAIGNGETARLWDTDVFRAELRRIAEGGRG